MGYLTSFSASTEVSLPREERPAPQTVLESIERQLIDYDADIVERGEGFVTFRVSTAERLLRYLRPRLGGWGPWWPFDFVSSGTLEVVPATDTIRITGDIRSSQWYLVPAGAFAIGVGVMSPMTGALARTLLGLLIGVATMGVLILLGKWQFRSWLHRVADEAASQ